MELVQDAYWCLPSMGQVEALAKRENVTAEAAAAKLLAARQNVIDHAQMDPYRYGFEPGIWWVYDAITDFPVCTDQTRRHLALRMGLSEKHVWEEFKGRMRQCLGFKNPARHVLVSGANRSGKSELAAKRSIQMALSKNEARVWALFMKQEASQEKQQPLYWKYLPKEMKRDDRTGKPTYIGYKNATGFSESRFVLPNGSYVGFRYYTQDVQETAEGGEVDLAAPDELMPLEWVDALIKRTSTRNGRILLTFTPVDGYTPTVAVWQNGMSVVRWGPGYVLDTDGKGPLPHLALGLTKEEYETLNEAEMVYPPKMVSAPESRPEDVVKWIEDGGDGKSVCEEAKGRSFEWVPRVAKCVNEDMAVLWTSPMDNPYGYPRRVIKDNLAAAVRKGRDEVRCRVYGIAVKAYMMRFPKLEPNIHVIPDAAVPKDGLNYCILDPAGGRNWAIGWIRSTPECDYLYRCWPGNYDVPGVGTIGAWAKTSGRRNGKNDGEIDDGQKDLGWGLDRYKFEIARLEGWLDCQRWNMTLHGGDGLDAIPDEDELATWDEENGAREVMDLRMIDSRAAASEIRVGESQKTSLIEQLNQRGMNWVQAPGLSIEEGVSMINDALAYELGANGVGYARAPRLKIAASCTNVIFALTTWQQADGLKGATKDWIDILRYFYQAELALGQGNRALRTSSKRGRAAGGRSRGGWEPPSKRPGLIELPWDEEANGRTQGMVMGGRVVRVRGAGGRVRVVRR